jgi:hypothetical protein
MKLCCAFVALIEMHCEMAANSENTGGGPKAVTDSLPATSTSNQSQQLVSFEVSLEISQIHTCRTGNVKEIVVSTGSAAIVPLWKSCGGVGGICWT